MIVGLLAAVACTAVACGGDEEGEGAASGSASPAASGAGGLDQAHAQANLDGLEQVPTWIATGEPFDAKEIMAGKSILSIPGTGSDPFYQNVNQGMADAANAVGYEFKVWNNQGQITQYQQGIANGITRGVSLIDMLAGPNPETLSAQIRKRRMPGYSAPRPISTPTRRTCRYVDADISPLR